MALSQREQRLKFLSLTGRDEQLLKALRPLFEKYVAAIEDEFYDLLLSFPETAQLLRDRTTVERLKKLQHDYLMRITEGNFDDAYFADRLRIGQTHERVGLSPRWYLIAYSQYFKLIAPLIHEYHADDPSRATESVVALEKAFMLDASLAMDAYIESDRFRRLQQLESIVNDSADVIFSLDDENRFRTWNRAAEKIFGWRAEEIIGQHINAIVPSDLVKAGELARVEERIRQDGHYSLETERVAKDGHRVYVSLMGSRDLNGDCVKLFDWVWQHFRW